MSELNRKERLIKRIVRLIHLFWENEYEEYSTE